MKCIKKYYRVDRRKINFLRVIFEAYDGIAVLRTLDPVSGGVMLYIAPGCEETVEMILCDLKNDIMIEETSLENMEKTNSIITEGREPKAD